MAYAATLKMPAIQRAVPLRDHAALPVFWGVFSCPQLPERSLRVALFTPLFHGVELVRGLTLDANRRLPIHVVSLGHIAVGARRAHDVPAPAPLMIAIGASVARRPCAWCSATCSSTSTRGW